jgi:hypothetical protein
MASRPPSSPSSRKPKGKKGKAKAAPKRKSYADLPWAVIREEYETTGISTLDLCRRYGISSDRTIRQRRESEGWSRNVEAITENIARAGIAATSSGPFDATFPPLPSAPHFATRPPPPSRPGPVVDADLVDEAGHEVDEAGDHGDAAADPVDEPGPAVPTAASVQPATPLITIEQFAAAAGPIAAQSEAERLARDRAPHSDAAKTKKPKEFQHLPGGVEPDEPPRTKRTRRDEKVAKMAGSTGDSTGGSTAADSGDGDDAFRPLLEVPVDEAEAAKVSTAVGLAELHIAAAREQIINADRLSLLANVIAARLMVAVSSPSAEDAGEARGALMFLSPDKETVAGLLKGVGDAYERAALMKRRALGMDPRANGSAPVVGGALPPAAANPSALVALAKGLPTETLMKVREAAAALAKLSPAQRLAVAPAPAPSPAPTPEEPAR